MLRQWFLALCLTLFTVSVIAYKNKNPFDYDFSSFASLPVEHEGRIKPVDSIAREILAKVRGTKKVAHNAEAIKWLLDLSTDPNSLEDKKDFLIKDKNVVKTIFLLEGNKKFYSLKEILSHFTELETFSERAHQKPPEQRSNFDNNIIIIHNNLHQVFLLSNSFQISGNTAFWDPDQSTDLLSSQHSLAIISPLYPIGGATQWLSTGESLIIHNKSPLEHPGIPSLTKIFQAYSNKDSNAFNKAIATYSSIVKKNNPYLYFKSLWESWLEKIQPLSLALFFYLTAFIIFLIFEVFLFRKGFFLPLTFLSTAFLLHTIALLSRIILQGRPPVTNLYSSVLFVGWTTVATLLLLLWNNKQNFVCIIAAFLGCLSLAIANNLSLQGDTMEVMRAVLDSNFWLSTHVITISIGYAATLLAGFSASWYILKATISKATTSSEAKSFNDIIFSSLCLSLFFTLLGTVLGGIWADQSWGRFWGWDPKENGALLIILWDVAILHARYAKRIQRRGLFLSAAFGNIITAFSWFGVNLLGIGLHSYGFTESGFYYLLSAFILQGAVIIMGYKKNFAGQS